ncbi:MAG: TonB-dependent receptor, partial [Candidatus Marinimicrobia bacterium]|nr:TonB-dependent receptor [Candidatus Neomarinimicrobiota bacterium]
NSFYLRPYTDEDVMWTGTENGVWDSYTQAAYPGFGGWDEVSRQLMSDNDPNNDLSPMGAYRLFQWEHRRAGQIIKPDYTIDMGFGGPVPLISENLGNLRFYSSFYRNNVMYAIPLATEDYVDESFTLKLTSDLGQKTKLQGSYLNNTVVGSDESNSGNTNFVSSSTYDILDNFAGRTQTRSKIWYPNYFCIAEKVSQSLNLKLTHTFNQNSYGELSANYRQTDYDTYPSADNGASESGYTERNDTLLVQDILPGDSEYWVNIAPFDYEPGTSYSIDGFYMGVKGNSRDNSRTSNFQIKGAYTNQVNAHNQIKTGFAVEFKKYEIDYGSITPFTTSWTSLTEKPYLMNAFIQDKVEYDGWVATVGLRAEYFNLNTEWFDVNPYDKKFYTQAYTEAYEESLGKKAVEPKLYLLPRLQVSHPISEKSKLYFNYGHMRQSVDPDQMFEITRNNQNSITYIGNPNIDFERTIQYELGFDQQLLNSYLLHIAGYYKDKMYQLNTSQVYESESTKGNLSYRTYENKLYQDIRGLEVQLSKNRGDWVTGFVNYNYRISSSGQFGVPNRLKS